MSEHSVAEIKKHVRVYIAVFIALAVLTVVTVLAARLEVSPGLHVMVALAIASVKGLLVLTYFMHLKGESKLILSICYATLFCFVFMVVVIYFAHSTVGPLAPNLFE